jgi:formyl-CoA transferase
MFIDNPTLGKRGIKEIGIAPKLSLTPGRIRRPSPLVGQDTEEVLEEIGLQQEEIAQLRSEGMIK